MTDMIEGAAVERFDLGGIRWYSPIVEDETEWKNRAFVPSVTTVLNVVDKGFGWNKWLGDYTSFKDAMDYAREAALVGTIVHAFIDELVRGKELVLPSEPGEYTSHHTYVDFKTGEVHEIWPRLKLIQNRLLAFQKFYSERVIDIRSSEIMLYSDDFAGTADMVGHIKWKKKEPLALIDYKTGKEYDTHQLQLTAYKMMWDEANPDEPIEELFGLYLGERGGNKLIHYDFDPKAFEHALGLWQWQNVERPKEPVSLPTIFTLKEEDADEHSE